MADRAESADERALRLELQELSKKREALDSSSTSPSTSLQHFAAYFRLGAA
jgi:hypothetical protein